MYKNMVYFVLVLGLGVSGACTRNPKPKQTASTGIPALDSLNALILNSPNKAGLWYSRAMLFDSLEAYDQSIPDYKRAITLDSTNALYFHRLSDAYLRYFKSYEALQTLQDARNPFPEHTPTLLKLAECHLYLKQYEASMRSIDEALQIDPQEAGGYFWFGMNFKEQGDTARAINAFKKATALDANLTDAWINLAQLSAAKGLPVSLQYFNTAIETAPDKPEPYHAKAFYLEKQNDLSAAVAIYQELQEKHPQYAPGFLNSGLLLLDMDSIPRAKETFDSLLQNHPVHIRGYYYRGVASRLLGDKVAAKKDFEKALQLAPDYEQARTALESL